MSEKKEKNYFLRFFEQLLLLGCLLAFLLTSGTGVFRGMVETSLYPRDYADYVEEAAARFGVEPNMVYAIIKAESGFCETAVSRSGAIGLMQLLPDTFLFDIRGEVGFDNYPSSVLFSAYENIISGTYYFARWRNYFNADIEALAAYNAGIGNVQKWLANEEYANTKGLILDKIPFSETREYVRRVLAYKDIYDRLYGKDTLPTAERVSEAECYAWAREYGEIYRMDPRFVMAIIKAESSFRAELVSISGAVGLMQMMEGTYLDDVKANLKLEEDFDALKDPAFNIRCGTYYLHWLDDRLDGYEQLAAAYNGGIGNVRLWLQNPSYSADGKTLIVDSIPREETRRYVRKVMSFYAEYCARYPLTE